jgi:hypothetical protein
MRATSAAPAAEALEAAAATLHGLTQNQATRAAAEEIAQLLAQLAAIEVETDEEPFRPRPAKP